MQKTMLLAFVAIALLGCSSPSNEETSFADRIKVSYQVNGEVAYQEFIKKGEEYILPVDIDYPGKSEYAILGWKDEGGKTVASFSANADATFTASLVETWFSYDAFQDGLSVSRKINKDVPNNLYIPSFCEGKPILAVKYFFSHCDNLETVTIPNGVKYLEREAFYGCQSLRKVSLPDSLSVVGSNPFGQCPGLDPLVEHGGAYLGNDANPYVYFLEAKEAASPFTVQEGCKIVGSGAFNGRESLTSVLLPKGLISIGQSAFMGCADLASIVIPDTVVSIEDSAFQECSSLSSITLSSSLKEIPDNAFSSCSSLTSITIPDGVTSIGTEAFSSCDSLVNITLPDSLQKIGQRAFLPGLSLSCNEGEDGCSYLGNEGNPYLALVKAPSQIQDCNVAVGCHLLADGVFSQHRRLRSAILPEGLISISESAFRSCGNLTSISIPEGVTVIKGSAFTSCGLASVSFPSSLRSIEEGAFGECGSLKEVVLPENIEEIGHGAFYYCESLEKVTFSGNAPSIGADAFALCDRLQYQEFSSGKYLGSESNPYLCLMQVDVNATSCQVEEHCVRIVTSCFGYSSNVARVYIPKSVTDVSYTQLSASTKIYCEAASKPEGFVEGWNGEATVYWGASLNDYLAG
ncbi:MAG: leucine-rich repeat domain-containing protein [Bacilli bacterium]|nr:leucine-rich repeat domain-containing protein [Bacilli bacterium]